MKLRATTKVLRAVLIAAVLVIGFGSGALDRLDKSRSTGATDCYTAAVNFHNAMMDYDTERVEVYYGGSPTCSEACQYAQDPGSCWSACIEDRDDELEVKGSTLFNVSLLTCTPESPDQCAIARQERDQCYAQYNPGNYSTPEEYLAVWSQLSACLEASKIQYCE
jgi:hypothetical protein